jgi:hypothetical protein
MKPAQLKSLRHWLLWLLDGGGAHVDFDAAVRGLPPRLRGAQAPAIPYSAWQLLEHLRLAQWDILEFSRNRRHVSPAWPAGYWPTTQAPPSAQAWNASLRRFGADLAAMRRLVAKPSTDLFTRIPWGDGQTILREALLLADHNAYHIGQLVLLRRALRAWKD